MLKRKLVVLYHSIDLDGTSSGWIVREAFKATGEVDVKTVGINYGYTEDELFEAIEGMDEVFCVDFSIRPEHIRELHRQGYALTIIDHHEDPIKQIAPLYEEGLFQGLLEVGKCGAVLCWEYMSDPDEARPWWLEHINDLDLWQFNLPETRPLSLAMSIEEMTPDGFEKAISKSKEQLVSEGKVLERYAQRVIETAAGGAFYMTVGGKRALVCQTVSYLRSELAEYLYNTYQCDFVALFNQRKDKVTMSLRSNKREVRVDAIARDFGGNGHPGAAGCVIASLDELGTIIDEPLVQLV